MINKFGKVVIPCEYSYLDEKIVGDNLIVLRNSGTHRYGFVDVNGKNVLDFKYKKAKSFSDGLAAVRTEEDKRDNWRFIDKQGNTVISPFIGDEKSIGEFHDGVVSIGGYESADPKKKKDGYETIYLLDKQGKVIVTPKPYRCYGYSEGLFKVRKEKRGEEGYRMYGLMNKDGNMVVSFDYENIAEFSEGLAAALNRDRKVGYFDTEGNIKIPFQFEKGGKFENGIAIAVKDGKNVAINKKGEILFDIPFEEVYNYHEGYAAVRKDGKWGFINEEGELKISCKFDYVGDFSDGLAKIEMGGQIGYMNKQAKCILINSVK